MPLVKGQCVNCGAILELDFNTKSGVCRHCGTPYFSEDVINNYITNNNIHNHIEHANIEMVDESSSKKLLENAEISFVQLNDSHKARELFAKVAEKSPGDYRGWWGLVRVDTDNFTNIKCGKKKLREIEKYANNAIIVAPAEMKLKLKNEWNSYIQKFDEYIKDTYLKEIDCNNIEIEELNKKIRQFNEKVKKCIEQRSSVEIHVNSLSDKKELYSVKTSDAMSIFYAVCLTIAVICCLFVPVFFIIIVPIFVVIPIIRKINKTKYENENASCENMIKEIDEKIKDLNKEKEKLEKKISEYNSAISKVEHSIEYGD